MGKPLFKGNDRILLFNKFEFVFALLCDNTVQDLFFCDMFSFPLQSHFAVSHDYFFYLLTLDLVSSDLDQLTEIMKVTGTPTQEFISKLQSQDVRQYVHYLLVPCTGTKKGAQKGSLT